jgi:hypothetical protein
MLIKLPLAGLLLTLVNRSRYRSPYLLTLVTASISIGRLQCRFLLKSGFPLPVECGRRFVPQDWLLIRRVHVTLLRSYVLRAHTITNTAPASW